MILFPNAKINIGLRVLSKRLDGFHLIESIFTPINLCDILEIIPSKGFGTVQFTSTGIEIGNGENLCEKAYYTLNTLYSLPSVKIHLHKVIPIGAGLGGGSADASFCLNALNQLFDLNINTEELKKIALKLGSDCPFFIDNKTVLAQGQGEIFTPIKPIKKSYKILLVYPNIHIATKEAYARIIPKKRKNQLQLSFLGDKKNQKYLENDFEKSVFPNHSVLVSIKQKMHNAGAQFTSLSGSGSSMFCLFENKIPKNLLLQFSTYFIWQGKINF